MMAGIVLTGWLTVSVLTGMVLVSVVMALLSLALAAAVLARLPTDYFHAEPPPPLEKTSLAARVAFWLGRNFLGLIVVMIGIVLALPGVPGQGVLTILIGLMLMDIPGRRRILRWLASRPRIISGINALRARLGRPPMDPPTTDEGDRRR